MSISDVPDLQAAPEAVQLPDDLPRRVYDSIIDFPDDHEDEAPSSFEVIDELPDGAVAGSLGAQAPSIGLPEAPTRVEAPIDVVQAVDHTDAPQAVEEATPEAVEAAVVEASAPVAPEVTAPPVANFKQPAASAVGPQVHHSSQVVEVLDSQAQFELGRSIRLVLKGWSIKGSAVVGNHAGADVILPENRIDDAQVFAARDYLRFQVRGRRMNAEVLDASEVRVAGESVDAGALEAVADTSIGIIRRDDFGDEDFQVMMSLAPDARLPDPRAALLSVDMDHEPLAASLFTLGLPRNSDRQLNLGGIEVTARCDGAKVTLRDYLASYRTDEGGFRPFFVSQAEGRFQTAPEDGSDIQLAVGDQLMVGHAIYEVIGS